MDCAVYIPVHLFNKCAKFQFVSIPGVKVIYVAVEDIGIDQCSLQIRAAFFVLNHHQKASVRQRGNQSPVVRVAGNDDERIHLVDIVFLTGSCSQLDVYKGFAFFDPLNQNMLHRYLGKIFEDTPRRGSMNVIKENDARNLLRVFIVKVSQNSA